jgi:hypothetical protein
METGSGSKILLKEVLEETIHLPLPLKQRDKIAGKRHSNASLALGEEIKWNLIEN